ncbi:MAG: TonB-dependent receptor, partial [Candidatus Aminicenantes bacterium]
MVKRLLTFLAATLLVVSIGFAQTAQTGAINGKVIDPDNVALPGVTVILKSPALVLPQLTTVTNASGVYRFPMLAPGTYEITFMLEGMNTLVRRGIVVRVGGTVTVDVGMALKTLEESVVVSGKAPTVDRQSTIGAANLDEEFLKSIPTQGRTFLDYFNLTPGVTGSTAHGSSQMDNSYNLDGVNMGDPATGVSYVGFGMDIMEEISVQTGGLTAEYGSVKGAVVNVVTKSGGNKFSGTASFYFNHESLQSDNTKGTDLYDPEGPSEKTGQKFQYEPVVTLGGPIVRDRVWFFGNFSFTKQEEYAPGFPHDKGPGEEDLAADTTRWYPYLKLTYHPNQQNKFMLSYNFSTTERGNRFASRYYNEDTTVTQKSPTHVFNLHWTRFFGENVYANLKLAFIDFAMLLHAKQPGVDYVNYFSSFHTGSYWRNEDNNLRDRYQVNLDATTFIDDVAGSHELKFGGEVQLAKVGWEVVTYSHPVNGVGYAVMAPEAFGEPGWYVGYNFNGGFNRKEDMLNIGLFVQDTWTLSNHLTLNLGLRYDYQSLIWPAQALDQSSIWNPLGDPVDKSMPERTTPMTWNDISPRLGLIYDIFANGTTLFKASWARYVQPNQVGWINIAHPNGWFAYTVWMDHDTGDPVAYSPFWSPGAEVAIGYGDHDLSAPYVNELTIGMEREMWADWSLGIRYIKKWDRNLIHSVDATRLDMNALFNNEELVWIGFEPKT